MNRDRKILLILFSISLVASLTAINMIILSDRHSRAASNRKLLENQYEKLNIRSVEIPEEEIDSLQVYLDEEKMRFFTDDETDPYKLGLEIIDKLETNRLTVLQYMTLEIEDSFLLEFSVQGQSVRFFSFWEDIYGHNRYYSIPQLSMKNEKEGISATFRIGYALYE